jgi:hypothetical protein
MYSLYSPDFESDFGQHLFWPVASQGWKIIKVNATPAFIDVRAGCWVASMPFGWLASASWQFDFNI